MIIPRRQINCRILRAVDFPDCGSPTKAMYGATRSASINHVLSTKQANKKRCRSSTSMHASRNPSISFSA